MTSPELSRYVDAQYKSHQFLNSDSMQRCSLASFHEIEFENFIKQKVEFLVSPRQRAYLRHSLPEGYPTVFGSWGDNAISAIGSQGKNCTHLLSLFAGRRVLALRSEVEMLGL